MKTLLYTGFDEPYERLAGITVPRMMEYAKRHGMDFMCHHSYPLINVPNGIYWTGVCGALKAFEDGYDRAIYLDVDQLVTNMEAEPIETTRGFHASKDWGSDAVDPWHFSMCGFIVHPSCNPLFRTVLESEPEWRDKPFPEQGPMQWYVQRLIDDLPHMMAMRENKEKYEGLINFHGRKVFNCVPDQVCPGAVPEPWAPGDWCAHLTMVDISRRIEIAKEILGTL
jgi:hypothetical protein